MSTPASPVSATESNEPLRYDKFLFALAKRIAPDPTCDTRLPYISGKERYHEQLGLITEEPTWTQEDRDELVELLQLHASTLPQLHGRMTDEEVAAFHRAYRSIPERPEWQPHIFSDAERLKLREERLDIRLAHGKLLKQAIAQGRLRLFDAHRLPQHGPQPDAHSFFTREDAQAYLKHLGLSLADVIGEASAASPVTRTQTSPSPLLRPPVTQPPTSSSVAVKVPVKQSYRKWREVEKDIAISCHERGEDAEGAEQLKLDLSTFRKYAKRWKEERKAAKAKEQEALRKNSANNPFAVHVRDGKKVAG